MATHAWASADLYYIHSGEVRWESAKMTPEYKAEKVAHVSFLGGGGIWEINYVTLVAPVRGK